MRQFYGVFTFFTFFLHTYLFSYGYCFFSFRGYSYLCILFSRLLISKLYFIHFYCEGSIGTMYKLLRKNTYVWIINLLKLQFRNFEFWVDKFYATFFHWGMAAQIFVLAL